MAKDNISKYNEIHGGGPGRPRGSVNKVSTRVRDAFALLLDNQMDSLESMILRIAEKDPRGAVELIIKISERFLPKLTQTQITGEEGKPLNIEFNFGDKTQADETNEEFDIEDIDN
jgi:hypothetical protein